MIGLKIYPFGNPFTAKAAKIIFNAKDYGVIVIKSRKEKEK